MKPVKMIKDPDSFKLLGDETRRKIVFLLRVKEMTVSQIAAELNLTPQAVSDYIKQLLKDGLITSEGRSRYRVSPHGVDWLLKQLKELQD